MKMTCLLFLFSFVFACESKSSGSLSQKAVPAEIVVESLSQDKNCSDMAFFQVGAEILSKTFDKSGKEVSSQLIKVLEVSQEGDFTVAKVSGVNTDLVTKKEIEVFFSYKCNGKSVFFDIASMYRTEAKNQDTSFVSGEFEFPLEVKVGETLPEISSSMESEYGGKKMSMTFHITERKVEALEEVSTGAGTWQCYRISNELQVEMDIPGMDPKMKEMMAQMQSQNKMTAITWFAPELGVIKTEAYKNGKLESTNQLVSIKK